MLLLETVFTLLLEIVSTIIDIVFHDAGHDADRESKIAGLIVLSLMGLVLVLVWIGRK